MPCVEWWRFSSLPTDSHLPMPRPPKAKTAAKDSTANLGFEADSDGMIGTCIDSDLVPTTSSPTCSSTTPTAFRKDDDVRWQFGGPPNGNANFAWVQHFIHHLAPQGMAGFVLANGSMSPNQSGERTFESTLKTKTSNISHQATA